LKTADAFEYVGGGISMNRKPSRYGWSMELDRELMALAKSKRLDVIADQLQRSPVAIIKRAARLGLAINDGRTGLTAGRVKSIPGITAE
jgi:hypothetical protein